MYIRFQILKKYIYQVNYNLFISSSHPYNITKSIHLSWNFASSEELYILLHSRCTITYTYAKLDHRSYVNNKTYNATSNERKEKKKRKENSSDLITIITIISIHPRSFPRRYTIITLTTYTWKRDRNRAILPPPLLYTQQHPRMKERTWKR